MPRRFEGRTLIHLLSGSACRCSCRIPKASGVKTDCSTAYPRMPPMGSVTPESSDQAKALLLEPVA